MFQIFQTAWKQTHDILLLSLAWFIFKACIWLLFRGESGWGDGSPRRRVCVGSKLLPEGSSIRVLSLAGLALNLSLRA